MNRLARSWSIHQPKLNWKAAELRWKSWPDSDVVFNLASGNTHLLTPLAAQILRKLEIEPADCYQLAERIASEADIASGDDLVESVSNLLDNLDNLGLIEPVRR
jgi:PqqD family protein of HPr-rel-A system